jgi:tetratricopeptide (TPR) repeat protein
MRRLSWLLLVLGLWSPLVYGKPTKTPEKLLQEAERLYRKNDFEAALVLLEEAYKRSGNPSFLFHIGQCQQQLKRYQEAIVSFEGYLAQEPGSEMRSQIEFLIKELRAKILPAPDPQPSSAPTSAPSAAPSTTPTTLPIVEDPPKEKEAELLEGLRLPPLEVATVVPEPRGARLLYRSSLGLAVGGLAAAGAAMQRGASLQDERAKTGDNLGEISRELRVFTISSEVLFSASAMSASGAYLWSPHVRVPKVLYGASGVSLGLGGALFGAALRSSIRRRELQEQDDPDVNELLFADERADVLQGLSFACLTSAALTGSLGYWLSKKQNPPDNR